MAKRCKFSVEYGHDRIAKFSHYRDAMLFARDMSDTRPWRLIEVFESSGIVGQFLNGFTTPEFREHYKTALSLP